MVKTTSRKIGQTIQRDNDVNKLKQKKLFDDIAVVVENINAEVSVSLPAANSMINLLRYDLDKVSKASQ